MGEPAYGSNKQRNKINELKDAEGNEQGVVTDDSGRKVFGTEDSRKRP